jgi:DNA polymerase-3 subunit gamma/tau
MFLFATTEPQKVPPTILSRCFHIAFPKATDEDIVHSLLRIVKAEKLTVDDEVLLEIAKMADGGFRDATKILEELVLVAGDKKIDKTYIESHYKTTNISLHVDEFLNALSKNQKNAVYALAKVDILVKEGTNIKYFIEQILLKLHEALLGKAGVEKYPVNLADFETEEIIGLTNLFSEAYQETKYAVVPQLPLELAVVEWCSVSDDEPDSSAKPQNDPSTDAQGEQEIASSQVSRNDKKNSMDTLLKKEKNLKVQSLLRGDPSPAKKPATTSSKDAQEELTEKTTTEQFMENLIYKVKPINFSVAGVLRGCNVKKIGDGEVIIEALYKFHKEKLDEGKTRDVLEKAIKEITGKSMKVMVELTKESKI